MNQICTRSAVPGAALLAAPISAPAQETQNVGKAAYETYCAGCHGISGKGNGPDAEWLTKPPADLTQLQKRNGGRFSSDYLFNIIDGRQDVAAHGPREMPVWGKIFKEQDTAAAPCEGNKCFYSKFWRGRILAIITYIRTLQDNRAHSGARDW
jgi:mono/diheme cytochrome c family protein